MVKVIYIIVKNNEDISENSEENSEGYVARSGLAYMLL